MTLLDASGKVCGKANLTVEKLDPGASSEATALFPGTDAIFGEKCQYANERVIIEWNGEPTEVDFGIASK